MVEAWDSEVEQKLNERYGAERMVGDGWRSLTQGLRTAARMDPIGSASSYQLQV